MSRRIPVILLLGVLAFAVGCTNKKVNNPLSNVGSKQPDKVLFDRAMDAMKHNRFDVARITLQTLINTYPDSEFIARAKLSVADSWYAEGDATSLTQAEIEYKDFETFFPNMPEAAEAQLKIANIHYQEMEKPDRDYTHAMRAEDEYRQLILQYPDNKKVVEEGKKRLLEVQEVIAEREYRVGRFYFLRQSYPASIARLRSLIDKYPLYSKADEALYLLGQAYEGEIAVVRSRPGNETAKARMIDEFTKNAADAYSRILTRYPLMDRNPDAKARLEALHVPIPKPTKAALAQNKAEEESRQEATTVSKVMGNFQKHPDVSPAVRVGEPTLVDPEVVSATAVVQEATRAMMGTAPGASSGSVAIETVNKGVLAPDQAAPRSDTPAPETATTPADNPAAAPAEDSNELKPNVSAPADPNELKPNVDNGAQAAAPPTQVNEIEPGQAAAAGAKTADGASATADDKDVQDAVSSSKHKKKKGLHKVIPF
jgi:outer membrane protein assembly factor BamD